MAFSLYVHIPFCLKRCIYCDFVSGIYDPEKEGAYIETLKKEILNSHTINGTKEHENSPSLSFLRKQESSKKKVLDSRLHGNDIFGANIDNRTQLTTLYIGGGTPTVLSADALSDLIAYIFKEIPFTENYETTIEANPGTLDKEKLQTIRTSGINRISIGIQSFNDDELNLLGRLHSSHDAEQAVYLAMDAGFENIGIDLIYGVPGQSIESWKKTLEMAVSLKPKHISAYELTVEKGTLLYTRYKMPSEEKIIEMYNYTIDYLESEGFVHYEISNFALPGYFCRHNLNYWDRGEYYGVGLGAHFFIKGKRFHNTAILDDYINLISADKSPVKETEEITEDKAMSEAIFLGLRKTTGINLKTFYQTQGRDILTVYHKEIKELREAGLIAINPPTSPFAKGGCRGIFKGGTGGFSGKTDVYLRLTRKGLLLSNEVFIKFM